MPGLVPSAYGGVPGRKGLLPARGCVSGEGCSLVFNPGWPEVVAEGQFGGPPKTYRITAIFSAVNPSATVVSVVWSEPVSIVSQSATHSTVDVTFATAGTYVVTATVSFSDGSVCSDQMQIDVGFYCVGFNSEFPYPEEVFIEIDCDNCALTSYIVPRVFVGASLVRYTLEFPAIVGCNTGGNPIRVSAIIECLSSSGQVRLNAGAQWFQGSFTSSITNTSAILIKTDAFPYGTHIFNSSIPNSAGCKTVTLAV